MITWMNRRRAVVRTRWSLAALGLSAALSAVACATPQEQATSPCGAGQGTDGPCGSACPCAGQDAGCGQCMGPGAGPGRGMGRGMGPGQGMGPGMGMGPGQGMGPGMGMGPGAMCSMGSGPLADPVRDAVLRALEDERRADAAYTGVLAQFGPTMPFSRIERAEQRHSAALERLLVAHGVPIPAAKAAEPAPKYADVAAACAAGAAAEKANIALYDDLAKTAAPDDVKCVFDHLRGASLNRHLPVFESCSGAK